MFFVMLKDIKYCYKKYNFCYHNITFMYPLLTKKLYSEGGGATTF